MNHFNLLNKGKVSGKVEIMSRDSFDLVFNLTRNYYFPRFYDPVDPSKPNRKRVNVGNPWDEKEIDKDGNESQKFGLNYADFDDFKKDNWDQNAKYLQDPIK